MSFHERFKGRTSLIDKEGITGIVKSQALPIQKPESPPLMDRKKKTMSMIVQNEKHEKEGNFSIKRS